MIIIEGQIGVGKTTLGEVLENHFKVPLYRELGNEHTLQILNNYYQNRSRWGFLSQTHFLSHRFSMILDLHLNNKHGIFDRSIFGDRIFAEMLHEEGNMLPEEYSTYRMLFDNMIKLTKAPNLMIYLDCSVDMALKRINSRNRSCEKPIAREYLDKLNQKYLTWYENYTLSPKIFVKTDDLNIFNNLEKNNLLTTLEPYFAKVLK